MTVILWTTALVLVVCVIFAISPAREKEDTILRGVSLPERPYFVEGRAHVATYTLIVRGHTYQSTVDPSSRRQRFYQWLQVGDSLRLMNHTDNPVDPDAVMVLMRLPTNDPLWGDLGYLPASMARASRGDLDSGLQYRCRVLEIRHNGQDKLALVQLDWYEAA